MIKAFEYMFAGSEDDYENIVKNNKKAVYSVVISHLRNRADADDIVQETFIEAYFSYAKLKSADKLTAWICGIARNKCLKHIRSRKYESELTEADGNFAIDGNPEEIITQNESVRALYDAIDTLPREMRETLLLHYIAGKTIEEICNILDVKTGTVKSRLYNARNRLKGVIVMDNIITGIENTAVEKIIKESIKIAKEKLKDLEKSEKKANRTWGEYMRVANEVKVTLRNNNSENSEADDVIRETYEQGIASALSINDYEGAAAIYDLYADHEFTKRIGDYGIKKYEKAIDYAEKAGQSHLTARFIANIEIINKQKEIAKTGKNLLYTYFGAAVLDTKNNFILPVDSHYATNSDNSPEKAYNTSFSIFGDIFPLLSKEWVPGGSYRYNDIENCHPVIFNAKIADTLEEITVNGKTYGDCVHVMIQGEYDENRQDPSTVEFIENSYNAQVQNGSYSGTKEAYVKNMTKQMNERKLGFYCHNFDIWYARNIGIIKVAGEFYSGDKREYTLDECCLNDADGELLPLSLNNWWSYKAAGDNLVDNAKYEYTNKFTVTRADGDNVTLSHCGWLYEK